VKSVLTVLSVVVCAVAAVGGAWFLQTGQLGLGFGLVGGGLLAGALGALPAHRAAGRTPLPATDGAAPPARTGSAGYEAANAVGAALDALR
jgi:hypothetical protein